MTDTTQEELPPLPEYDYWPTWYEGMEQVGCRAWGKRSMQAYARKHAAQCIATLKAENAIAAANTLRDLEAYAKDKQAAQVACLKERDRADAAQSQAAAMAGLLEEVSEDLESAGHWGGSTYAEKCQLCQLAARINAALATWKGNTK